MTDIYDFPSPIMGAPVMQPADAPERERLHGLIGTAIVTQVRVLQLQTELTQQEIAQLQRQNTASN